jgi:(p)ppGpp synthase/HD superfamily hydrolase
MFNSQFLDNALVFAARAHDGQKRKSTDVPYVVHPVGVMLVLLECGEIDPALLAAALLHDTLEDTAVTLAQLRNAFGERVAGIVEGCSEPDKRDSWEHRKKHTIAYLRTAPRDIALVSAADKLHNVRSMVRDHAEQGDRLWTRFKRGRADIAWYYRSIVNSLGRHDLRDHALVQKLADEVAQFFAQ